MEPRTQQYLVYRAFRGKAFVEAQIDIGPGMGPNGKTLLADLGNWVD